MSILSAQTIIDLCETAGMVKPFARRCVAGGYSGGLGPSGYDVHIAEDVILHPITLKNLVLNTVNIKRPSFSLASTIEHFIIPKNVMAFVVDKSTWARQGLALQNTCLEPGWPGYLTLELSNHGGNTIYIERGSPIAQIVFYYLDQETSIPYVGKYSNQKQGPQEAIFEQSSVLVKTD